MEDNKNKVVVSGGGCGFAGLLTIVFIALKLCGVINWSWLWVLSPLWISLSLVAAVIIVMIVIYIVVAIVTKD